MPNASNFDTELNAFFTDLDVKLQQHFPNVLAETATEYFKDSFRTKSWDGIDWQPYKNKKREPKRGSLMVRSNALAGSIKPSMVSPARVVISAGGSRVPYARIHNEGGIISRAARSETFVRNRHERGQLGKMFGGMGAYRKGTTPGRGLTFKAYTYNMPKRQYMGKSQIMLNMVRTRFKQAFKPS